MCIPLFVRNPEDCMTSGSMLKSPAAKWKHASCPCAPIDKSASSCRFSSFMPTESFPYVDEHTKGFQPGTSTNPWISLLGSGSKAFGFFFLFLITWIPIGDLAKMATPLEVMWLSLPSAVVPHSAAPTMSVQPCLFAQSCISSMFCRTMPVSCAHSTPALVLLTLFFKVFMLPLALKVSTISRNPSSLKLVAAKISGRMPPWHLSWLGIWRGPSCHCLGPHCLKEKLSLSILSACS